MHATISTNRYYSTTRNNTDIRNNSHFATNHSKTGGKSIPRQSTASSNLSFSDRQTTRSLSNVQIYQLIKIPISLISVSPNSPVNRNPEFADTTKSRFIASLCRNRRFLQVNCSRWLFLARPINFALSRKSSAAKGILFNARWEPTRRNEAESGEEVRERTGRKGRKKKTKNGPNGEQIKIFRDPIARIMSPDN